MTWELLIILTLTVIVSYILTHFARKLAIKYDILDHPQSDPARKKHKNPIPLMGATGFIILGVLLTSSIWLIQKYNLFELQEYLIKGLYVPVSMFWVMVSIGILVIAGYLDDTNKVSNKYRFLLVGLALLITIFLGKIRIEALSYPFNELLPNIPYLPEFLAFLWLGFCLFSTKVLDGHDGIVSIVGGISLLSIASISTFAQVNQPLIFILALVWFCCILGFLPFNYPNARLYLGDGGSMIIGFVIGLLSIMAGAKIATSGTVIGWFIVDILFVWFRRILDGRSPLTSADRYHWHQRLADIGLNKVQVLAITTFILLITSSLGLMIQTREKVYVLVSQIVFLLVIFAITWAVSKSKMALKKE
jgi:UDP-GlcNAc:undecaprenyl-phosphate GlcNAc-1-phosphate transferase